jgi:[protein-PII] uridylyltransferase
VRVAFDLEASTAATVVEVHAPDEVALLARVAAVFADLDLDVTAALVSTLGARVVDVFYVRDQHGAKLTDPLTLDRLRATLVARLSADSLLS